jgi:WD40 repeat protein
MAAPLWPAFCAALAIGPSTSPVEPLGKSGGSWQSRDVDQAPLEPGVIARIGSARLKHGSSIRAVAFSPNGGLVVSADMLGTVIVWETATGRLVRRWDLALRPRESHAFSPDGARIVCPFADDFIVSYDIRSGAAARERRPELAPTPPGDRRGVGRSDCGRWTATIESAASVLIHDGQTGGERRLASTDYFFSRVGAVRFSPDLTSLFVGDAEGGLLRLDRVTGKILQRYGPFLFYPPDIIAISADGTCLAVVARNRIHLLDVATGADRFPQPDHFAQPPDVRIAADGQALVLSGGYTAPREEVWDWAPVRRRSRTSVPLSGWQGGTPIFTRHAPGGRVRVAFGGNTQFNQFDTSIVRFTNQLDAPIWSVKKGLPGHGGYAFSPDGSRVCVVEESGLGVYESQTGRELARLTYPAGLAGREWAGGVEFTPDGLGLITAHPSGLAYWPVGTAARPREHQLTPGETLDGREGLLTLSPDGRVAVIAPDRCDLIVFEVATLRERFRVSTRHRGPASSYAFTADSRYLAVANGDSTVTIHDLTAWPPPDSSNAAIVAAWSDLASPDAGRADRAMRTIAARPDLAPQWLRQQFGAVARNDDVARLIDQLDARRYAARETAQAELVRIGHAARPALVAASRTPASAESRQRLTTLLTGLTGPDVTPDGLRADRAVELLERIRTPDALRLLKEWSTGPDGATLTESARFAIARVEARR